MSQTLPAASIVWTPVSTLAEFQGHRTRVRKIGDLELLLIRTAGGVVVAHNRCTHLGKSLEGGRIMAGHITCPFHGACFDLKTGAAVSGPAVLPLQLFAARLDGEIILADLSSRPANPPAGSGNRSGASMP